MAFAVVSAGTVPNDEGVRPDQRPTNPNSRGSAILNKEKDLRGSIESLATAEFVGTTMFVAGSGTGQATHLGQLTHTFEFEVDLPTGEGVGSAEFTAANGDSLITEIAASLGPRTSPGFNNVVEEHTIVGGTGRFAGACGSFTLDRLISLATSVSVGTVDGTIVNSKAK